MNKKSVARSMPRPNFFIVGAPKCGTTSMYRYLRQHPEVFMPELKEPHFLAPELEGNWPWHVSEEGAYLALFAEAGNAKWIGEASVWYLYSTEASRWIKQFSPEARIIAMLRNPVDMLYSLHWNYVRNGTEDLCDFGAAMEAEEDRRNGLGIPKATPFVRGLFYCLVPLYAQQLRRYFNEFGQERVLVIIFDDLVADTAREYRRVVRFLEISADFSPDFVVANPATSLPRYPFSRFVITHPRLHRVVQATLPLSWRRGAGEVVTRFRRPPPPQPPMDPLLRSRLQAHFAPEIEELSRLLDRDLTHWSRSS